jgi:thioredoxin reductase
MKAPNTGVIILGAGPYGLSIAAHLGRHGVPYQIFGKPMQSWRTMMPKGMSLKSEGFASSLYDPGNTFTLADHCREIGRPYADVGIPVPLETFVSYGLSFQRRFVPKLEQENITMIEQVPDGFAVKTESGQSLRAGRVVVAAGITHFPYLPATLEGLPAELVTHSSQHSDLRKFRGRRVAVIGAGASAVDVAALLHEGGAAVELVARSKTIAFHDAPKEPRPLSQRLMYPRSTIGVGWRSRLCVDAPWLFRNMPQRLRHRVVRRHLGPAPGWFVKDKVVGRFPLHLGVEVVSAEIRDQAVHLRLAGDEGSHEIVVDHVIAGTGYRVDLKRLAFLDERLRHSIRAADDTPVLGRSFESSVPGLYFVGVASANTFGPLTRFACGAEFTATRLAKHLSAS